MDFNEVQIVPSRHGNAESREAIRTTGLVTWRVIWGMAKWNQLRLQGIQNLRESDFLILSSNEREFYRWNLSLQCHRVLFPLLAGKVVCLRLAFVITNASKDRYMKPLKLKGDGKIEVTIHYVSDETLVQEDEVGNTYVFKKMSDSYPIPYVLRLHRQMETTSVISREVNKQVLQDFASTTPAKNPQEMRIPPRYGQCCGR